METAILMVNLSKKDIDRLFKGTDPFVKEILQIWSEALYEENIRSYKHLISSPLWHNSLIRIANSPVFYKEWFLKGITKVKHLMDDSSNFLSLTAFQNKYDLRVRPLTFYGIISAIKFLHRQNATNQSETNDECSLSTFLESEKSSRLLYKKLVSKKVSSLVIVIRNGSTKSTSRQTKPLIGKRLTSCPFNVRRARN